MSSSAFACMASYMQLVTAVTIIIIIMIVMHRPQKEYDVHE